MTENEFKPCPKCDSRLEMRATCCPVCGWSSRQSDAPILYILAALAICPLGIFGVCWVTMPISWTIVVMTQQWWFWPGVIVFFGSIGALEYWRRKARK